MMKGYFEGESKYCEGESKFYEIKVNVF